MQMYSKRVYGIIIDGLDKKIIRKIKNNSLHNSDFVEIAERQGLVWTLQGFEMQFNDNKITNKPNLFIRFISKIIEV